MKTTTPAQGLTTMAILLTLALTPNPAAAQTDTTFTYQGSLREGGVPANGPHDIDVSLWNAAAGGAQIGSTQSFAAVPVADGLLTLELDFGTSAFDNTSRWVEISVNGSDLSPRQPITRAPYSIQTRGIVVDEDNNVGIGTSTPVCPLHLEIDDFCGILSINRRANGFATAGSFLISSTGGIAVHGDANAATGTNYGVYGESGSTAGRGVHGEASASSGTTYGGHFVSESTAGRGVYGEASAATGTTYGGHFVSESPSGTGVYSEATAATGINYGVYGASESPNGTGVFGDGKAATGNAFGVYGFSRSTSGTGVYGDANAATGNTFGVYGFSRSTSGTGVRGFASNSGINYGGWFESSSTTGRGVFGLISANSGVNYAVVGHTNSSSGFDFWASGAGTNYGSPSSRRWKSNVVPIGDPLSKLAQLSGVYFDWDDEHGGLHDVGMIAEEVGGVMPELVQYEENGIDAIGMDYSKMTPLLVEGVNALRAEKDAEIAALSERNAALESRLARLETLVAEFTVRKGVEQ